MTTEGAEALYNADQLKAGENLPPFGSSRVVDFCWLDFFLAERGVFFSLGDWCLILLVEERNPKANHLTSMKFVVNL